MNKHLSKTFVSDYTDVYRRSKKDLQALPEAHHEATRGADRVVVVAFRSVALKVNVPNEFVADYASRDPKRLIPFCCVDPNEARAASELKTCIGDLHMKGLKLGPIYQHFDPNAKGAYKVFETAQELKIPVLIHQGTTFVRDAPLRVSNPTLLDQVATNFPDLKLIVAHLGHPWEDETIALIRKQPNVYSDISGLTYRPSRLYLKLVSCLEYGVMNKLVLGSDFPFGTTRQVMRDLRRINRYAKGTQFPRVPRESIEAIISENAAPIFGRQI